MTAATNTKPVIELRKVHHSKTLSEETPAYTAEVWIDGKLFCHVQNHGQGGPDDHHAPKSLRYGGGQNVFHANLTAMDALIGETFPKWGSEFGGADDHKRDLEMVCHELLGDVEIANDLRRLLKRTIAYVDPSKKGIYSFKGKLDGVQRAHVVTETLRKMPTATILNNLPFDAALAIYKREGGL